MPTSYRLTPKCDGNHVRDQGLLHLGPTSEMFVFYLTSFLVCDSVQTGVRAGCFASGGIAIFGPDGAGFREDRHGDLAVARGSRLLGAWLRPNRGISRPPSRLCVPMAPLHMWLSGRIM